MPRMKKEILGDYWHSEAKPKGNFEKRKRRFAEFGWRVIGIWENELKTLPEEEILQKVMNEQCGTVA